MMLPTDPDPSFVYGLYKAGHLVPAIIVASFFALRFAETKIAWLRIGYRKVIVAAAMAGLGMLGERVASGTTPNLGRRFDDHKRPAATSAIAVPGLRFRLGHLATRCRLGSCLCS
jgi:hypothetical protein